MSSSLVLGLGNPLSGADAFGPAVIDWLRCAVDLPPTVELVDAHTDLLAYLYQFGHHDHVILVDTVLAETGSGGVQIFDEATFSKWDDGSRGAHELSPLTAVKLFRRMHAGAESPALRVSPRITLVAHVVREQDFRRLPTHNEIAAGATAVRRALSAAAPTVPLGSLPSLL